jgi:hypothetical protein
LLKSETDPLFRLVLAAKEMSIRDFFQREECLLSVNLNNAYVQTLAPVMKPERGGFSMENIVERAEEAIDNLRSFNYVGTTENQITTVNIIRKVLGLSTISTVPSIKVTADEMTWHEWMEPFDLATSADVLPHVKHLISGDQMIYHSLFRYHHRQA